MKKAQGRGLRQQHNRRVSQPDKRRGRTLLGRMAARRRSRAARGTGPLEGGFSRALHDPLAGPRGRPGKVEKRDYLGARTGFSDLRGPPARPTRTIAEELKKGKQLGDRTYKVPPRWLQPDGPDHRKRSRSARHEIFYFTEGTLSAIRVERLQVSFQPISRVVGWVARSRFDWPIITISALIPSNARGLPQRR